MDDSRFSWLRISHEQRIGAELVRITLVMTKNFLKGLGCMKKQYVPYHRKYFSGKRRRGFVSQAQ